MELARGISGELRVGYQIAARLGRWSLTVADERFVDGRWTCHAEAVQVDEFWRAYSAQFHLVLAVGQRTWWWRSVTVAGDKALVINGEGRPEIV